MVKDGLKQIFNTFKNRHIFKTLTYQDIKTKYSRSKLGVLWMTINISIQILVMALVFGYMLSDRIHSFFPHLVFGLLIWIYVETFINESCLCFIEAERIILQTNIPILTHLFRIFYRSIIIFGHNILVTPFVLIFFQIDLSLFSFLIAFFAFILLSLFILSLGIILSTASARYRDIPNVISNLMRILFYFTPVIWMEDMVKSDKLLQLIQLNPFYGYLKLIRDPILYSEYNFAYLVIFTLITISTTLLSLFFFSKYYKRIAYWV